MCLHGLAAIGTFLRESRTGTAQPFGCRYLFADRFGLKADRTLINRDVRSTPKSGHLQCTRPCLLWANSGHSTGEDWANALAYLSADQ
jgi:hypothetical protein